MNSTIACQMQKVDFLPFSLYLCYLDLCRAVLRSVSVLLSGFLVLLKPHPGWSGCQLFFLRYLIIHIIVFILLLAVLVTSLGNVRKSRLCFRCSQL